MGGKQSTKIEGDGEPTVPSISPPSHTYFHDFSTKIDVFLRIEDLQKLGDIFVVAYTRSLQDVRWTEVGRTESNCDRVASPNFLKSFSVDFRAEAVTHMRFEVYRARDLNAIDDLQLQKFVGMAEATLTSIVSARSRSPNGDLVLPLLQPLQRPGETGPGRLCLFAEEDPNSKFVMSFTMRGDKLRNTDVWKRRPDAYCIFNRTHQVHLKEEAALELEGIPVFRTEVCRKTSNPKWHKIELSAPSLCNAVTDREIMIEIWDWYRVAKARYIGRTHITMADLQRSFREGKPIVKGIAIPDLLFPGVPAAAPKPVKKTAPPPPSTPTHKEAMMNKASTGYLGEKKTKKMHSEHSITSGRSRHSLTSGQSGGSTPSGLSGKGSHGEGGAGGGSGALAFVDYGKLVGDLIFDDVAVMRSFSLVDYLRGGLEIKIGLAIDFTRSNKSPDVADSRHHLDPQNAVESAYVTTLRSLGLLMQGYMPDERYALYGFGAQIPPTKSVCSDCFALTGDFWDPEVQGIEGMLLAYKRALKICRLHGPSHLHAVIRLFANMAKPFGDAITPPVNGIDMKYFVLVILTDGEVHEQQKVVDELVAASDYPLSVVVIALGDEHSDLTFLKELPKKMAQALEAKRIRGPTPEEAEKRKNLEMMMKMEEERAEKVRQEKLGGGFRAQKKKKADGPTPIPPTRKMVHVVDYNDYRERHPADVSEAALSFLPSEVVGYFLGRNVKVRNLDKYEDELGWPLPRVIPNAPAPNQNQRANGASPSKTTTRSGYSGMSGVTGKSGSSGGRPPSSLNGPQGSSINRASIASGSTATGVPEVILTGAEKAQKEFDERMARLPPFLKEERERLQKEAAALGYDVHRVNRALRDGVPSASVEVLVDNIVNSGYGKSMTYKECAEAALEASIAHELQNLPGSADGATSTASGIRRLSSASSMSSLDLMPTTTTMGAGLTSTSNLPGAGAPMPLLDMVSLGDSMSRETSRMDASSFNGTWDGNGTGRMSEFGSKHKRFSRSRKMHKSGRSDMSDSMASSGSLRSAGMVRFTQTGSMQAEMCKVCMEAPIETKFFPCGHSFACCECALKLRDSSATCQLCQGIIKEIREI